MPTTTKTNDLRKLVQTKLASVSGLTASTTFYMYADSPVMYPHATFTVDSVDLGDLSRQDYTVDVDLWDKGPSAYRVEELADLVEAKFTKQNLPQTGILPTFYLESRRTILDEDKSIRHVRVSMICQNYEV